MASGKVCCVLPTRIGALVFLYYFLINSLWVMLSILTDLGDPMYKEFLKDNAYIFYVALFIALIGGVIYLATMISILNNTPSVSLLCTTKAFLLLHTIYSVYVGYQYTCNGVFHNLYNTVIEKHANALPLSDQDGFRNAMNDKFPYLLKYLCVVLVMDVFVVLYAVVVFTSYVFELQEELDDDIPVCKKIKHEKANLSELSTLNALQSFTPPPQYSTVAPQCKVESGKP